MTLDLRMKNETFILINKLQTKLSKTHVDGLSNTIGVVRKSYLFLNLFRICISLAHPSNMHMQQWSLVIFLKSQICDFMRDKRSNSNKTLTTFHRIAFYFISTDVFYLIFILFIVFLYSSLVPLVLCIIKESSFLLLLFP